MKKSIILLFICVYSLSLFAQDSAKTMVKEYYLTLVEFTPLTLQLKYKQQIGKKSYFKLGIVNLSAFGNTQQSQDQSSFPTNNYGYSGGVELGIEFRQQLNKKFSLFHGPNVSLSYRRSISRRLDPRIIESKQKNISETYRSSIPYSLGILFNLNSNILLSAELNPNINYNYQTYKDGQNQQANIVTQNISIGFDNKLVLLSIVYRL